MPTDMPNKKNNSHKQLKAEQSFLNQLPDPLFQITRRKHRVVWTNKAAKELLGYDPVDKRMDDIFPVPAFCAALKKLENDTHEQRINFTWKKHTYHELEARLKPLALKTVMGARAIVSLHDQTEMKRVNRMRADFVANANHELRTPLTTLYGAIETLAGPAGDDKEVRQRFLRTMHDEASRMRRLIEDMLSLSRIEMNEATLPDETVHVGAVIHACVDALRQQINTKAINLVLDLGDHIPTILGKEEELHQTFINLIENAIKYGRESGQVKIKVEVRSSNHSDKQTVCVHVIDDGEGIAEKHLPRLTERFYRIDKGRSRTMGGTGLGLAIVKHIVSRHQGSLSIESVIGMGTTVTV